MFKLNQLYIILLLVGVAFAGTYRLDISKPRMVAPMKMPGDSCQGAQCQSQGQPPNQPQVGNLTPPVTPPVPGLPTVASMPGRT